MVGPRGRPRRRAPTHPPTHPAFPPHAPQVKCLTHLDVSGNELALVPDDVWMLPRLARLDLSDNPGAALPPAIPPAAAQAGAEAAAAALVAAEAALAAGRTWIGAARATGDVDAVAAKV